MLSSLGVAPVSEVLSSLSSVNSIASDASVTATPEGSLQPASLNGTGYNCAFSISISLIRLMKFDFFLKLFFSAKTPKRATNLSVVAVQATEIPPREMVTYSKQTQTTTTGGVERDGAYSIPSFMLFQISNAFFKFNHVLCLIYASNLLSLEKQRQFSIIHHS